MIQALLVGNPNCGKTTLFNALTGQNQRVGNWPGVTVEKKTGIFATGTQNVQVTDLPGVYSLSSSTSQASLDETITAQMVAFGEADFIINVIDACYLERHLFLTSQLLELGKPMIIALNMMDIAQSRGICINIKQLSQQLNCPVIAIQAHRQVGLDLLRQECLKNTLNPQPLTLALPQSVQDVVTKLTQVAITSAFLTYRFLEGAHWMLDTSHVPFVAEDMDIILADARYSAIHAIVQKVQKKSDRRQAYLTAKLDRLVLNRFAAWPIFLGVMYLMFVCSIHVGTLLQGYLDEVTQLLLVRGPAHVLQQWHSPSWLISMVTNGLGKGLQTTLTFIPVMGLMYFCLAFLETSGYMVRAAFVMDKLMRFLGLPGQAFVPMIIGFGCNVPAIMAARTMHCERERRLTILMSPFMSCSARLAIYAVFVAAFFPNNGANIVFSLYMIGIVMAILTGFLLKKYWFKGQTSPLILELPAYHRPSFARLLRESYVRVRLFLWRAGQLIIPICILLAGFNTLSWGGVPLLSKIGQYLTPLFAPMGLHQSNWPATVALITGSLAKEVVIGTLNSLYSSTGHSTIGILYQQFDGKAGAYAYLLFILLYIPCISTMAAIRQETTRRWMWFSIGWSLLVAYVVSVAFYQVATWSRHPQTTLAWMISFAVCGFLTMLILKKQAKRETYVTANS